MTTLEPTDEPHREPTPPPWWGRADRGPTTAELRAHTIARLESDIAAGWRCAFCHVPLGDTTLPCTSCGGFSRPGGGAHVVQPWER